MNLSLVDSSRTLPPTDIELAAIVRTFHAARVLVIGDVILDRYITGSVHRLSPEAPIPVLRPADNRSTLGGAANVALNIATLGGQAVLVGVIGSDAAGDEVERLVQTTPGITSALVRIANRPTTSKTRFMTGSHQLLRLDEETTAPLDRAGLLAVMAAVEGSLEAADVIVLSDYAKGALCDGVLAAVLSRTTQARKLVIADPKRSDFAVYRGATILTPNEHEVRVATRIEADEDTDADRAGRVALEATGADAVLVTRSAKGLTLVCRDQNVLHLPTRAREVADVSGAGDTLVAALAVALGAGAALPAAAMLANATAGISVGKQGTATVGRQELLDALHLDDLVATDRKVASLEEAIEKVADWRRRGLKIGFANGCFDLIHPGHVRLLSEARGACDRLIVALNTDASVKRLKGPSRPLQNEMARATVMASMAPVDLVTLFDDDTPLEMIQALRPDVLVKGSDYTVDQVVGGDLVQGWGGKVVLVTLRDGHSTTGTIRRMTVPAA
ncbi:MAG: D-glycero-beta-D-manno-heptose-7-phosphate kinase [Rhodopila sp.]|jgi:D-beta-D-heptose 7-phosphate kinase/D-beta-D-heptose 1-phosphate adenosyltransferase